MKDKIIGLILILTLCCNSLFSQSTKNAKILSFKESVCDFSLVKTRINERIIDYVNNNDTTLITIGVIDNCAKADCGLVKTIGDTVKLGKLSISDEIADCTCYFELKYELTGIIKDITIIKYNNKILEKSDNFYLPAEYTIENGDSLIIWDNKGYYYQRFYYDTGELKRIKISKGQYWDITSYYKSGNIKKSFLMFGDFDKYISKKYDITGKLIKYENTLDDNKYDK